MADKVQKTGKVKKLLRASRRKAGIIAKGIRRKYQSRVHIKHGTAWHSAWRFDALTKGIDALGKTIMAVPLQERLYGATHLQEMDMESLIFERDRIFIPVASEEETPEAMKEAAEKAAARKAAAAKRREALRVGQKAIEFVRNAKADLQVEFDSTPTDTREGRFHRCELRDALNALDEAEDSLVEAGRFTPASAKAYHRARHGSKKVGVVIPESVIVDSVSTPVTNKPARKPVSVRI